LYCCGRGKEFQLGIPFDKLKSIDGTYYIDEPIHIKHFDNVEDIHTVHCTNIIKANNNLYYFGDLENGDLEDFEIYKIDIGSYSIKNIYFTDNESSLLRQVNVS